jgi:hypothetical protein
MDPSPSKPCICPYCEQQLADPLPFCDSCGKEIITCTSCGCALSPVQNICPSCGARQ